MTENARSKEDILMLVEEVNQEAAGGAEALYMAAMLADSPLPYDFALSIEGTPHNPSLINPAAAFFAATATIDPLVTRDLIKVDVDDQIYQLHEDVRSALLESLSPEQQLDWAGRAIYALNLVLPDAEPQNWPTVEWLMPHVEASRGLIDSLGAHSAAANRVLHQTGFSLYLQSRFDEAADYLDAALAVDVAVKGRQHPDIVADLEGLGTVLWAGQDLERAEAAFMGCLDLQNEIFTKDNPLSAPVLNSLGVVRQSLGKFDEAEAAFLDCVRILTQAHGEGHPSIASCLSNMALLYEAWGRPSEALRLAERSLEITSSAYGPDHPEVAADHNTVALLNDSIGNMDAAQEHFRKALVIREKAFGLDHPETAQALCNLALLLDHMGEHNEAADMYEKGLTAYEAALGPGHPLMDAALENYIVLLEKTGLRPASDLLRQRTEEKLKEIVQRAGDPS